MNDDRFKLTEKFMESDDDDNDDTSSEGLH